MPNWVWCAMNRFRMFFIQISTLPTSMHRILTERRRSCMQINQFLTESHVQWERDFMSLHLWTSGSAEPEECNGKKWALEWSSKQTVSWIVSSAHDFLTCFLWWLTSMCVQGNVVARAVIEFCDDGPPVSFSNCLLLANCLIPHLYQVFIFDTQKHWVFFLMILYSKIMSFFVHCFEQYTFNETWTCYPRLWTPMTPHQGCSIEIN